MESLWEESRRPDFTEFTHKALGAAVARTLADKRVEPAITSAMMAAVEPEGNTAELEGLAARVKSPGSMARKIKDKSMYTGRSEADVAASLKDTIRYTVRARDRNDLVETARRVADRLVAQGYEFEEVESFYAEDAPYKGLHATVRDRKSGTRVEVQFHSEESLEVKEGPLGSGGMRHGGNHEDYEFYRSAENVRKHPWECSRAYDRCVERSRRLQEPAGLDELKTLGGCPVQQVGVTPVDELVWYVPE